jgi:type III restriction enzyme
MCGCTTITRRSLARILTTSGRLDDFKRNPQQFIELATESINRTKRLAVVDGIKYQRIGDVAVKVYAKLPGWFKVPTPLGTYNPDWAVLVEKDGAERLYFVVETKSSLFLDDLRDKESAKIECGKAHFEALAVGENPAKFIPARNIDDLMAKC